MIPTNYVHHRIFNLSNLVLLILLSFIAMIVFSNVNVILSKAGFETTTTLKGKLATAESEIAKITEINAANAIELELALKNAKTVVEETVKLEEVKSKATVSVDKISKAKQTFTESKVKEIREVEVITADTITLPISKINELSAANITQVHDVFAELFPTT